MLCQQNWTDIMSYDDKWSLLLPFKITTFIAFYLSKSFKSIFSETTKSKQKWMESNGALPQWVVVSVRLSLQVQKAAVSWQTITEPLMASVFAISTRQTEKHPQFIPPALTDYWHACVSLSFLPSFNPILLVPFLTVVTTWLVFCVWVMNTQDLQIICILLLCFCSLKPSLLSPQSLPWSLLPNSSVKHLRTVTM